MAIYFPPYNHEFRFFSQHDLQNFGGQKEPLFLGNSPPQAEGFRKAWLNCPEDQSLSPDMNNSTILMCRTPRCDDCGWKGVPPAPTTIPCRMSLGGPSTKPARLALLSLLFSASGGIQQQQPDLVPNHDQAPLNGHPGGHGQR